MNIELHKKMKVTSESLDADKSLVSTLMSVSDTIKIDHFTMSLSRFGETIEFDMSDIFMNDAIEIPSLDFTNFIKYFTITCTDLKPFIKALSWKDPTIVVTSESDVLQALSNIILKMYKNPDSFYYYHDNPLAGVKNICGDVGFCIKYQETPVDSLRLFALYNNRVILSNFNQMTPDGKKDALTKMDIILEAFDE